MVNLSKRERQNIALLERRLAFLNERIKEVEETELDQDPGKRGASLRRPAGFPSRLDHDIWERGALLWVLEVMEHAVALNCEEVFAFTTLRQLQADKRNAELKKQAFIEAMSTLKYRERSQEREAGRKVQTAAAQSLPPSVGQDGPARAQGGEAATL